MAGGSQFAVVILAIFVVPKLMAFMPDFDPLMMIIGVMGLLAVLQQLGFQQADAGSGGDEPSSGQRGWKGSAASSGNSTQTPAEMLEEAERCLAQNSYGRVQELARIVSDKDPENARAWELLVEALKWDNERDEAASVVQKARDIYEVNSPRLDALAAELSKAESPAVVATECEAKAQGFLAQRQYDLAAECFSKALEALGEGPSEQRLRLLRGSADCAQQLQDWGGCRRAATAVLEADPKDVQALLQRAASNEALEKWSAALDDARSLLALDPKNSAANRIAHNCQQALRD